MKSHAPQPFNLDIVSPALLKPLIEFFFVNLVGDSVVADVGVIVVVVDMSRLDLDPPLRRRDR